MYAAFNRRDRTAALDQISPEIEIAYRGVLIDAQGSYRGYEGFEALVDNILETVDLKMEAEDLAQRGDQVAVAVHQSGPGTSSGVTGVVRTGHLWTLRDGKVVRLEVYKSREEAWEALEAV